MAILFDWFRGIQGVNLEGKVFTATEMGILLTAATHADTNTGRKIHPGIRRLAAESGAKPHTVSATLAKAREMRVLERVWVAPKGSQWADEYQLVNPTEWNVLPITATGGDANNGNTGDAEKGNTGDAEKGNTGDAEKGNTGDANNGNTTTQGSTHLSTQYTTTHPNAGTAEEYQGYPVIMGSVESKHFAIPVSDAVYIFKPDGPREYRSVHKTKFSEELFFDPFNLSLGT